MRRHALPKKTFEAAAAANAHLIVQIKDNQPTLYREVEAVCAIAEPLSSESSVDKNRRNRHETRAVAVFEAKPAVAGTEWEPHVAAIIRVERTVLHFQPATGRWKSSFETSFYLSSRPLAAKTAAASVRQHWGITSHYSRDVMFLRRRLENTEKSRRLRQIAQLRLQYPHVQSSRHDPAGPPRRRLQRPQINVLNDLQ